MNRSARAWAILLAVAGCDRVFGLERIPPDAPADAALPTTFVPFGAPMPMNVNTAAEEDDPSLTGDMLELYIHSGADLWWSKRDDANAPWPAPTRIAELSTSDTELRPSVSLDGLTMYFARGASGGGQRDILVSTRASREDAWGDPALLALDLNGSETSEHPGWSSPDGLALLVESFPASGDHDLYLATRATKQEPFTSVPLDGLNLLDTHEGGGWAIADGSTIVFESDRSGVKSIWEATRSGAGWITMEHLELEPSAPYGDGNPWLSPDGKVIVFTKVVGTSDDFYMATR